MTSPAAADPTERQLVCRQAREGRSDAVRWAVIVVWLLLAFKWRESELVRTCAIFAITAALIAALVHHHVLSRLGNVDETMATTPRRRTGLPGVLVLVVSVVATLAGLSLVAALTTAEVATALGALAVGVAALLRAARTWHRARSA